MRHLDERHKERAPLTEAVVLILLSLAQGPRHGYSILQDVEEMSEGRVRLSTGTLYGALRRLLEVDGWIERHAEDDAPRERTAYRLTDTGRAGLEAEVARMKVLTRVAALRMGTQVQAGVKP
jgi:DNA-binding PadR family transcriptional regulator